MNKLLCKRGFSLAEMLVVLLVISVVASAAVPLANKRFKVNKAKAQHGKYICYRNASDQLHELEYKNNAIIRADAAVASCTFTPSAKAAYFIVQVIGGGGGGAYAGAIPARDTSKSVTSYVSIPTNGTVAAMDVSPPWLEGTFNSAGITVTGTVYGGGGGGGNGNGTFTWASGDSQTTCNPFGGVANNSIAGCRWSGSYTTGGPGGNGGACSRSTTAYMGMSISASSGNGGSSSSSGGSGSLTLGSASCTATGGSGGTDATSALNGSRGSDGSPASSTPAGGSGGYGFVSAGNSPGSVPRPGATGSSNSPSVWPSGISYSFGYHTKQLPYGARGEAGEYKNVFFTKLPNNLSITVGTGGAGGTSGSPSGGNGGSTLVGVLAAAGGAGGTNQSLAGPFSLYSVVHSGASYVSSVFAAASYSPYTLSVSGVTGAIGGFYAIQESASPDGSFNPTDTANTFGNGGNGGGSDTCVGYTMTRSFNGPSISSQTEGNASCLTAGSDSTYNHSYSGSKGQGGAVVIIW